MVKVGSDHLTRANVLQIGFGVFVLGAIGYFSFRFFGLEGQQAGIASEALLILIVCVWTGTYLFRVFTGKMTFNEQRKRYREAYEKITSAELLSKFESMTDEEQNQLIKDLEVEQKGNSSYSD